jgi:hypothetical protein
MANNGSVEWADTVTEEMDQTNDTTNDDEDEATVGTTTLTGKVWKEMNVLVEITYDNNTEATTRYVATETHVITQSDGCCIRHHRTHCLRHEKS